MAQICLGANIGALWPRLSSDEKKLFETVARAYLGAVMPDFRYRQTTVTLNVCGFAFRATGRQPIELGWRAAFPDWQPDAEKGDEVQWLPTLCDGEPVQLKEPSVERKETRAPVRYNEGTLIEAMKNAWRFVDDGALRARLKEAKGIGTPASSVPLPSQGAAPPSMKNHAATAACNGIRCKAATIISERERHRMAETVRARWSVGEIEPGPPSGGSQMKSRQAARQCYDRFKV